MGATVDPGGASKEAFCRMVEDYQVALLRTCYVMLRDYALAEDAVQETFLKAYRASAAFRGDCSEKTWLMRIAMNTCRDMRRSAWFRRVDRRVTPEQLPEACVPFEATDNTLIETVMNLPCREKEILLLYFYQDMTLGEIAQALGFAPSTVSAKLKRTKEKLRAVLEGGENDE